MTVAFVLLWRVGAASPIWVTLIDAAILGLGLGMVMQVLVLAVQNSVDFAVMGTATSGSTLFRQVGGSIGVALFGTIFANRLGVELAKRLPPGAHPPKTTNPDAIRHLPPLIRTAYSDAIAVALHPVFLTAAVVSAVAFGLTWLLREVPLRTHTRAGDAVPPPRDERSAVEAVAP
jgi:hypothetical protein